MRLELDRDMDRSIRLLTLYAGGCGIEGTANLQQVDAERVANGE